ncbi:MAG TPA: DNA mismatch repair endonuclease MutL, partial [Armatimonadetes bacterium]|nr:DNA mismatch repair endonuclease MutL [Armatimonadota bacterium]
MPNRIHVLDPDVSAQIAAGEVVERPASVVKELIENALDAEAMHILIEVEAGGRQLIRVTDDGHGMSPEDAVLAFQRHATSKIRTAEDLQRILTFGFRGEALPSIAAVSHVELITREPDRDEGTKVVVDGGVVTELSTVGCPVGTSVSVRRLFYNVPARLKFMRSPTTEMNHIVDIVSKFILANPHVSFTLRHHGRDIIHHSGDATRGDMRAALITVWGRDVAREMVPIELSVPRIRIYGFVSKPSLTKSARTHQVFFVNRRWVRHHALSSAVTHAYRGMIPAERQPVCVIYIDIEPLLVDVNVHPTKIEVRFANQAEIQRLLVQAIQQALSAVQLTPTITSQPQVMKPTVASPKPSRGAKEREREELEAFRRLLRQKVDGVATPQETLPAGVQPAERVAASVDEHRIETASRGAPGAGESPSQDVKAPKAVPPQH